MSSKLSAADIRGSIGILSSDSSILPFDNATAKLIQKKHPPAPYDIDLPALPTDVEISYCTSVSREEVRKCIAKFGSVTWAGPVQPGRSKKST